MFWTKQTKIVEIEALKRPMREVPFEALETLQHHPGFVYLTQLFALERAYLRTQLEDHSTLKDIRQDDFLRAGIYWSSYFERKAQSLAKMKPTRSGEALTEDELEAFKALQNNLTEVGLG